MSASELAPTVRMARDADAESITALVNEAYVVEAFFKIGPRTDPADIRAHLQRGAFLVLDRKSGGGLAAAIYIAISNKDTEKHGYFGMLSVSPAMQGLGLGRRMIAVAEAYCQAHGCTAMDLQLVSLRTELPPFYGRLGYREYGTAPFDDEAREPCHFILMTKPLGRRRPSP